MTTVLVIAAIAIPNLMRSRTAANEAEAAATLRTVNTAQVTYATQYPDRNFAPNLATLGTGEGETCAKDGPSASHACLLDGVLGCSETWCVKNGYRYNLTATCKGDICSDYVIVGTPVAPDRGGRSFCSTSDAVVRFKSGPPLESPVSVDECQAWQPL